MNHLAEVALLGAKLEEFRKTDLVYRLHEWQGHLEWMVQCVQGLFERAPFKADDRVMLVRRLDFERQAPSWKCYSHFLVPGAIGTVHEIDFRNGKFYCWIDFDNQTWIPDLGPDKGIPQPVQKHGLYCFSEQDVVKCTPLGPSTVGNQPPTR